MASTHLCGKNCYVSAAEARKQALRVIKERGSRGKAEAYYCGRCEAWHWGAQDL